MSDQEQVPSSEENASQAPTGSEVHVFNPYGDPETISKADLPQALKIGYRPASPEEVQSVQDQQKFGPGLANTLKAFGAGALRGATFGVSDQILTDNDLVDPHTLKALEEQHKIAGGVGEGAAVAASLLVPGLGEENAARAGLEGADVLATAGLEKASTLPLTPVGAVSKLGHQVTSAASGLGKGVAGSLFNPETSPMAHAIVAKALPLALGSATEGAFYGLGHQVTEDALGDPNALGEKLLPALGYSSLMAGGIGGIIGGAVGAWGAKPGAASSSVEVNSLSPKKPDAMDLTTPSAQEAMSKDLKPNASEIEQAGIRRNYPISPAQLTSNKTVQHTYDLLLQGAPTFAAQSIQKEALQGFQMATQDILSTVGGEAESLTAAQLGDALSESIGQKIKGLTDPAQEMYEQIKPFYETIPVEKQALSDAVDEISSLKQAKGKGLSGYSFARKAIGALEDAKDVDTLKEIKSNLMGEVGALSNPNEKYVAGAINDILGELESDTVSKYAEEFKGPPEVKAQLDSLLEKRAEANSIWREFKDKLKTINKVVKLKNNLGPSGFVDALREMPPETLVGKLYAKNNSRFLDFFQSEFPDAFDQLKTYQKTVLRDKAFKGENFSPKAFLKTLFDNQKTSPELRAKLFNEEELGKLKDAKTYLDSFPEYYNGSNTDNAHNLRSFFTLSPSALVGRAGQEARDAAMSAFVKNSVKISPETGQNVAVLAKLEKLQNQARAQILSSAKSLFKKASGVSEDIAGFTGGKLLPEQEEKKKQQVLKAMDQIRQFQNNPKGLLEALHENTLPLYGIAPRVTAGIQQTALKATDYLSTKLPPVRPATAFSPASKPTQSDIDRFTRAYNVLHQPRSVFKHLSQGTLTPEAVEALESVMPKTYQEIGQTLMDQVTTHLGKGHEVPRKLQLGLSLYFGQSLDHSTEPDQIRSNQVALLHNQTINEQNGNRPGNRGLKPTAKSLGKVTLADRSETALQSTANRDRS